MPLAFATSVCGLLGFGMLCCDVFDGPLGENFLNPLFWVFILTFAVNVVWGLQDCADHSPRVMSGAIAVSIFVFVTWVRFL